MRNLRSITQHMTQDIWVQYSKEYLIKHPDCFGKYYSKIENYYIFRNGTKSRNISLQYPVGKRTSVTYSMSGLVFSYPMFRKIVETYLKRAITEVAKGYALHINSLGKICMKRVERDFRKRSNIRINWPRTMAQEKVWNENKQKMALPQVWSEKKQKMVDKLLYFTDDDWCRVGWFRPGIANDMYYEFRPTKPKSDGTGGFIGEVTRQMSADPLLKYNYLFQPIRNFEHYTDKRKKQQTA